MSNITFQGNPVNTTGNLPGLGDSLPNCPLLQSSLENINLSDLGPDFILNIFPSVDTPVCANSMKIFNQLAQEDNINVYSVSKDLPFALSRFCTDQKLSSIHALSAFQSDDFGKQLGVMISENQGALSHLLSRVVIVYRHHKIVYAEQVCELTDEPNYQAAKSAYLSA